MVSFCGITRDMVGSIIDDMRYKQVPYLGSRVSFPWPVPPGVRCTQARLRSFALSSANIMRRKRMPSRLALSASLCDCGADAHGSLKSAQPYEKQSPDWPAGKAVARIAHSNCK
jgi:hypothetical protein